MTIGRLVAKYISFNLVLLCSLTLLFQLDFLQIQCGWCNRTGPDLLAVWLHRDDAIASSSCH